MLTFNSILSRLASVKNTTRIGFDLDHLATAHHTALSYVQAPAAVGRDRGPQEHEEARIRENHDVYGFSLDEEDMGLLAELDQGSTRGRSFRYDFFKTDTDVTQLAEFPYRGQDEY